MTEKQVWLITGASRGLGVDIAKAALSAGHAVVATGRDAAKVSAAVGDHESLLAVRLDVTRPPDAARLSSLRRSDHLSKLEQIASAFESIRRPGKRSKHR